MLIMMNTKIVIHCSDCWVFICWLKWLTFSLSWFMVAWRCCWLTGTDCLVPLWAMLVDVMAIEESAKMSKKRWKCENFVIRKWNLKPTWWSVGVIDDRCCHVGRHCTLQSMLFNFRAVCCHLFPHVCNLIGRQRLAVRKSHAHNKELVFVHRLDLLAFLNHHIDVGGSDRWKCSRRWSNAIFIRSRCFDLKNNNDRMGWRLSVCSI